jgi:hypothetical protein
MFELQVMQNQWLMLALIGGLAVMLVFLLGYPPLWRRREPPIKEGDEKQPGILWLRSFLPWILVIVYGVTLIYSVVYVVRMAFHPPNW